jgi:ribokinase
MRVAVVGHVEWVDFVPVQRFPTPGGIVHAQGSFARAAGGGSVVAAVLAELGAQVDFFTALGEDEYGRASAAELADRGIAVHVGWRKAPTRRAVTLLEPGGERTIITLGDRLDPSGSDPLPWELLGAVDGVYVTAGDASAMDYALAAKVVVASPRARAALEGEGRPLDALVLSERDHDELAWAQRIGHRVDLVLATDGARGGRWWGSSEGRWEAAALPGEPRDAYGCGDSFAAGFTFALAAGEAVASAAALGARRGALCLTRVGAP